MGMFNLIRFRFTCQKCSESGDVYAQCRTPKYHEPQALKYDGKKYFYEIGDVMAWHEGGDLKNDWPGDYAFVSRLEGDSIYVIEPCHGSCAFCKSNYSFYFYLKDRRIMRLIGYEDADLNMNSVVAD